MKRILKDSFYSYAFLLIGAVWLFILSLIFSNYWSYTSSARGVQRNLEKYIWAQEKDVYGFLKDSSLIVKLADGKINESLNLELVSKQFGIFLYKINDDSGSILKYWNTQQVLPDHDLFSKESGQYLETLGNGKYDLIIQNYRINGNIFKIFILIPIHWDFFVENGYLKNGFVSQLNADKNFVISSSPTKYPIRSLNGKILYYLKEKKEGRIYQNDWFTISLRLLAILLFMLFIYEFVKKISRKFGTFIGCSSLIFLVFIIRFFSYIFNFPFDFRQFELFSPMIYGSNFILKSLGDLIVNTFLFLWIVLFIRNQILINAEFSIPSKKEYRNILSVLLISMYSLATVLFGMEIQSMVSDSSISFDVTNFFSLNLFTLFGFLALCLLTIVYSVLTLILFHFIYALGKIKFIVKILLVFLFGIFYILFFSKGFNALEYSILIWMLLYFSATELEYFKKAFSLTIIDSLKWILIYTVLITLFISTENRDKEIQKRVRASEKIALDADPYIEKLYSISLNGLKDDLWIEYFNDLKARVASGNTFDTVPFSNIFSNLNRFQNKFYFFDSLGNPIASNYSSDFNTLSTLYNFHSKSTSLEGLRYYEKDIAQYNYIYQKQIVDLFKRLRGYVFITSSSQKINAETKIPELFKILDPNSIYKYSIYSYGVYHKGSLAASYNNYAFESNLDSNQQKFEGIKIENQNGFSRLWYKKDPDRVVMIVRKSNLLLENITLFAYIFCIFLILIGLIKFTGFIVASGFNSKKLQSLIQFDLKSRIFSTIISISLISFMVVGTSTVYFFIDRYHKNNEEKISRTIRVIADEFKTDLKYDIDEIAKNIKGQKHLPENLNEKILDIAEIHNVDLNIYGINGELLLTTQPLVYGKLIQSNMMNPQAFHHLSRLQKILFLQTEKTGNLEYLSVYKPLMNKDRNKIGFINIPYFTASYDLNQEISNFLVVLINLNTFIFLIAGLITIFLTARITSSLDWIGRKMREVNIGTNNELITWKWNDEIGGLVKEYNKMVLKLEENVKSLARNEREGAWREMARQVAHEIKNPLTPMKLSIQYLQRSIDTNASNVKELTASVARTLIEQIEHLSKIASEFSHFANIGNVKNEFIEINALISSIVSFHATQEHKKVIWSPMSEKILIEADKTQMNRLFNNLIRNAIESIPENAIGKVEISGAVEGNTLILEIYDNGSGIPEDMHDKIFSPNFTTKTSGTGLGLAICKGIVEQAKGKIWFNSGKEGGTCFYISFPIATIIG